MLQTKTFVFNILQVNTYVLNDESGECIIVDPGCSDLNEEQELSQYIETNRLKPIAIINTHCHIDHLMGCYFVKNRYHIKYYTHKEEITLIDKAKAFGLIFGIQLDHTIMPDEYLDESNCFSFGNNSLEIFLIPGHSPGSIALYNKENNLILTGDVLFNGSIGRTDLPGGNYNMLIHGIQSKLLTLPPEVRVFPGHGPESTIGQEKQFNPFLQ